MQRPNKEEYNLESIKDCNNFINDLNFYIDKLESKKRPQQTKKTLEDRKRDFVLRVNSYNQYNSTLLNNFCGYWTEHNENGKKMRFEMSKNQPFNINRRLSTWKSHSSKYNNVNTKQSAFDLLKKDLFDE